MMFDHEVLTADNVGVDTGDVVWNYYDRRWVRITHPPQSDGWFDTADPITGERGPILNGERVSFRHDKTGLTWEESW
jgi:hypothetical protein